MTPTMSPPTAPNNNNNKEEFFLPLSSGKNNKEKMSNNSLASYNGSVGHPGYGSSDDGYSTDGQDTNELFSMESRSGNNSSIASNSGIIDLNGTGKTADDDNTDYNGDESTTGKNGGGYTAGTLGSSSRREGGGNSTVRSGGDGSSYGLDIPDEIFAKEETRAVLYSKAAMLVSLCFFAVVAGFATYYMSKKAEFTEFEVQVRKCVFMID